MSFNEIPGHEVFESVMNEVTQDVPDDKDDMSPVDGFQIDDGNDNPFDEHFKLFIKNPEKIDDAMLDELGKLIDGKYSDDFRDMRRIVSKPDTVEQLKSADMVEYITYDGNPVGVLTVTDPTVENYMNIIPRDTYSMHSAYNLDNRVEVEYFVVASEYDEYPIAEELSSHLIEQKISTFLVCPADDDTTINLMNKVHYKYIKTFRTDSVDYDVNLYVNG